MDELERFVTDLQRIFASEAERDELKSSALRKVAAFIGRAVDRGDHYAPPEEVWGLLAEARSRIQSAAFEGQGRFLRLDVLSELDKAMAAVQPRRLPKVDF